MESFLYLVMEIENRGSIRSQLLRAVLEHFMEVYLWEVVDTVEWESELQKMMDELLGFKTHVTLAPSTEAVAGMLSGRLVYEDDGVQHAISFDITPSGTMEG